MDSRIGTSAATNASVRSTRRRDRDSDRKGSKAYDDPSRFRSYVRWLRAGSCNDSPTGASSFGSGPRGRDSDDRGRRTEAATAVVDADDAASAAAVAADAVVRNGARSTNRCKRIRNRSCSSGCSDRRVDKDSASSGPRVFVAEKGKLL